MEEAFSGSEQPVQPPHPSLDYLDHRPWPLPHRPWSWRQSWHDLLFLHWAVDPDWLQEQLPAGLEADCYNGQGWIGLVPFTMSGVTRRGFPAPSLLCDFPEINVRTYVIHGGKPGVWFFSLDVPNPLAVWVARTFFGLPYFNARMRVRGTEEKVEYRHRRGHRAFEATYRPRGKTDYPPGSFEIWSTERYCLYSRDRRERLCRAEVHHRRWPLEDASADIRVNTLLDGLPLGERHPSALFSRTIDVVVFPLERVDRR
ncbi:MAG: DUF2071 domain-containing protein [Puniceicoccaceae bacterium]|nr:MAG: DUF2071 domain-containing protein [Puniceicoccaceae bacterium]